MATNPMQRKSRNSFLLGMILTLIVAAGIVALLYMKIKSQNEEIEEYRVTTSSVYVLNQDVKAGQILTEEMFSLLPVPTSTIPLTATQDIFTTLSSYSLYDTNGNPISLHLKTSSDDMQYYCVKVSEGDNIVERPIYKFKKVDGKEVVEIATDLTEEETAFYYAGNNNTGRTNITVAKNAAIAKVAMKAQTVITSDFITRSDEKVTKDIREAEYNVISLPVDLITGDYVDIRFVLPNGQDFVVVSKKRVTIPAANGAYLTDTIQMNLNESEILSLSAAIVENLKLEGSKIYANKYTEAGIQQSATQTYVPNQEVLQLIEHDPNVVQNAIKEIKQRQNTTSAAIDAMEKNDDNLITKTQENGANAQEARKNYLQGLVPPLE